MTEVNFSFGSSKTPMSSQGVRAYASAPSLPHPEGSEGTAGHRGGGVLPDDHVTSLKALRCSLG